MKRTKLAIATGSLLLACTAVVIAKPAKKFSGVGVHVNISNPAFPVGSNSFLVTSTLVTTTVKIGHTIGLATAGGTFLATMLIGSSGTSPLYFK